MSIEALPFVNWIFWGTLSAGMLLVVGWTAWRGGTTPGYRTFMAWLIGACGAIWLASELGLTATPATVSTADARRILVLAFVAACGIHLWGPARRRAGAVLAGVGGLAGLGAVVVLAAAGGADPRTTFAANAAAATVAMGSVASAMLLGHWYLVTPQLSPQPLRRMIWLLMGTLVLQGGLVGWSLLANGGLLGWSWGWLLGLRLLVGIGLPLGIAILALLATRSASLQATTGLLYIGLAMVMAGTIGGASLSYLTGVAV